MCDITVVTDLGATIGGISNCSSTAYTLLSLSSLAFFFSLVMPLLLISLGKKKKTKITRPR